MHVHFWKILFLNDMDQLSLRQGSVVSFNTSVSINNLSLTKVIKQANNGFIRLHYASAACNKQKKIEKFED